jgi:hypothetical protein
LHALLIIMPEMALEIISEKLKNRIQMGKNSKSNDMDLIKD